MDLFIENARPTINFVMVPAALIEDATLSARARLALIYMCSKPPGYLMRVAELRSDLGLGDHAWRQVSRELRDRAAMVTDTRRCRRTGRVLGTATRVTWEPWLRTPETSEINASVPPVDKSTETSVSHASEINATHVENQRHPRRKSTPLIRERDKKGAARAAAGDTWAPAGAVAGACGAGRGDGLRPPQAENERALPSIERRREIARELGLPADEGYSPGLWDHDQTRDMEP